MRIGFIENLHTLNMIGTSEITIIEIVISIVVAVIFIGLCAIGHMKYKPSVEKKYAKMPEMNAYDP
jgi:hypothetical protein